jgi:hypothetical protein
MHVFFRYSVEPLPSNDQSANNSTLREKAISLTRVRCKKRISWLPVSSSIHDDLTEDYWEASELGKTRFIEQDEGDCRFSSSRSE